MECKKQINLLIIEDGEKRHYTAIKSIIAVAMVTYMYSQDGVYTAPLLMEMFLIH